MIDHSGILTYSTHFILTKKIKGDVFIKKNYMDFVS